MTNYEQYVEVQKKIEALEATKESLREKISEGLPEDGYKDETITAFWKQIKKWTYSPKIKELETKLKKAKRIEERNGRATVEESKRLGVVVSRKMII